MVSQVETKNTSCQPADSQQPKLWIVGLGAQYPPYLLGSEKLEKFAARFYDEEKPGLKKLLEINRNTGIETRSSIRTYEHGFGTRPEAPSITELDHFFREHGVNLATQACKKALREWGGSRDNITHTVAVTCTNQGHPGYDLLVHRNLALSSEVDRMLLHGVGCAGGLAILRAAAQIANGATAEGKPARILGFACELCTPYARHDLAVAQASSAQDVSVAGALFSDGAAAFVMCNTLGRGDQVDPLFELMAFGSALLPDTVEHMTIYADEHGHRTILTRDVPAFTRQGVKPMFEKLLPGYMRKVQEPSLTKDEFDWALHPGGEAIIDGVQDTMHLSRHQLRATREIYRTRGNSSSPTVLIVLDKLRHMGIEKDHVVATSFGPGLVIEMAMLKHCRKHDE